MSTNDTQLTESRAFDGETFGRAIAMDRDREFDRDSRGRVTLKDGPAMVADELLRALLTKPGSDPIRPEYGLDLPALLSRADQRTGVSSVAVAAVADVIGPRADPRVDYIDRVKFARDDYNRVLALDVFLVLDDTDQTPIKLRAGFEDRLGRQSTASQRNRAASQSEYR